MPLHHCERPKRQLRERPDAACVAGERHYVRLRRRRRRLAATLRIIEAMIAAPRIMLNVFVLLPPMTSPSRSTPSTSGAEKGADDRARPAGEGGATDDGGSDAVEHQL